MAQKKGGLARLIFWILGEQGELYSSAPIQSLELSSTLRDHFLCQQGTTSRGVHCRRVPSSPIYGDRYKQEAASALRANHGTFHNE